MVGNRVFSHCVILCISLALLFAPWGTLTQWPSAEDLLASDGQAVPTELTIYGWQGAITLGPMKLAYWSICAFVMLGSMTSALNYLRWTSLSSIIMFTCFGMGAACSLVALIQHAMLGTIGGGSVITLACALIGLAFSPSDPPVEVKQSLPNALPAQDQKPIRAPHDQRRAA